MSDWYEIPEKSTVVGRIVINWYDSRYKELNDIEIDICNLFDSSCTYSDEIKEFEECIYNVRRAINKLKDKSLKPIREANKE